MHAPRRADSRRNREAILAAAATLLEQAPDVTMADVATAAGVTRATVYRHFADRDALLDALGLEIAGAILPDVLATLDDVPLLDVADELATFVTAAAAEHPHLVVALAGRIERLAREAVSDEPLTAVLAQRRAAGELRSPLSDAWIAAAVRALCLAAVADPRPADAVRTDLATTLRLLLSPAAAG